MLDRPTPDYRFNRGFVRSITERKKNGNGGRRSTRSHACIENLPIVQTYIQYLEKDIIRVRQAHSRMVRARQLLRFWQALEGGSLYDAIVFIPFRWRHKGDLDACIFRACYLFIQFDPLHWSAVASIQYGLPPEPRRSRSSNASE